MRGLEKLVSRVSVIGRIAAALVIVVAAAWSLERWTFMPLRCARAAWHGARAIEAAENQGDAAVHRAARNVRANLSGCECTATHEVFFTLAGVSATLGEPRSAMAEYGRALEIDRRPETYFELGMTATDAFDARAAIENLTRACAFDPRRIADIRFQDIRSETTRRIRAAYGDDWIR